MQSRYYDPIVKRFLNADSYASTGQGFLGYNMFAYCGNNPANGVDASGTRFVNTMMTDSGGGFDPNLTYYREVQNARFLVSQTKLSKYDDGSHKDVCASLDITRPEITEKLYDGNTAYYYSIFIAEETVIFAKENPGYQPLTAKHAYYELQSHIMGKEVFSIKNCDSVELNQSERRFFVGIASFFCWIVGS